eukprot:CAMPEP_0197642318 /NCGR_PEP_ID=MMETSP1338-20131121/16013_1 /TAXON_ID=43686 ORGANISM="Pelagodinium beii, Strain RCC1491" /NCGR_SAMPLE_ID=MMETSP1338 /ASSEMBLY_ACC=CAM_ASM_000754 /LENGTH=80 /DNA_ID=CAMNT_0043215423 /DNA_START=47 /DNA_END=289 /DNA_ORIENTATION=+
MGAICARAEEPHKTRGIDLEDAFSDKMSDVASYVDDVKSDIGSVKSDVSSLKEAIQEGDLEEVMSEMEDVCEAPKKILGC